jgi:GntR family transcriptional regulator
MKNNRTDGMPLYLMIEGEIRREIESGKLKIGDKVSSERKLAKIFGVSLMTARHALIHLMHDGLLERRRAAGTYVSPPRIQFNKLLAFSEQMCARHLGIRSRVLSARICEVNHEIAARLALPGHAKVIQLERVRLGNGEPFAIESCFLPAKEFGKILRSDFAKSSLFEVLERDCNARLAHADEEVDATSADPRTSKLLKVPLHEPLLRIRQVLYSTSGKAVAYSFGLYRSDRHSVLIRRYR